MAKTTKERPLGVTILAILEALAGLMLLAGGVILLASASLIKVLVGLKIGLLGDLIALFGMLIGLPVIILGLLAFIIAHGLWTGKKWAWALTLTLSIMGLVLGLISLPRGILDIVINALILYYLTRPHVKEYFG